MENITLERGKLDAIFDAQRASGAAGVWVKVGFPLAPSPLGGKGRGEGDNGSRKGQPPVVALT